MERPYTSMPSENGATLGNTARDVGRNLIGYLSGKLSCEKADRWNRRFLLVVTAFILTLIVNPRQQFVTVSYKAGDIATTSIKASRDFLLEDTPVTEKKRAEAETAAPLIYVYNTFAGGGVSHRIDELLALVKASRDLPPEELRRRAADILGFDVTPEEMAAAGKVRTDPRLRTDTTRAIDTLFARKIVADKSIFANDMLHGVVVAESDSGRELNRSEYVSYIDVLDAGKLLEAMRIGSRETPSTDIFKRLVARAIQPNLTFDREASEKRRREAREAVRPVLFQIKRGEMVVREGERILEDQAMKLRKMYERPSVGSRLGSAVGIFSLILVMFYFPYRFGRKNIRKFNPTSKDLLLLCYVTVGCFLLLKLGLVVATSMGGAFPFIHTSDYFYLFPFALGAMLVRIVLNSEVALVYCAVCAPLVGIMFENSLLVVVYSLMAGIVGAHGVRHCKDRGTLYKAALKVSVVNLAMVVAFQVLTESLLSTQTVFLCIFGVASGLVSGALATATVPVLESLFGYTTDIKLLELANLDSPLLRELMIKAPGTYHHSILVGNLVEAAAEAINANPLLARVAAYYHDIGKLSKPLYFIENLSGGENRHDRLSPNMSALILISHVKEGAELAKEHRLGQPIIDIIRESHGTALITFFHQKAKKEKDAPVDERDYRYPGPKPQTREAGLVMLADCVEAASRTLADPTPARIQGMVQKIINNIFNDGQLDECELTLKNLHEIAKSFIRILSGIYHHRIDYPEPAYKEKSSPGKKSEDNGREQTAAPSAADEAPERSGGEDLRRLGISR